MSKVIRITGTEATVLSYVARHGPMSAADLVGIELTPNIHRVATGGVASRTVIRMREISKEDYLRYPRIRRILSAIR